MGQFVADLHSPRLPSVRVAEKVDRALFENEIKTLNAPVLMKGFAKSWQCVEMAAMGPQALAGYLKTFDAGAPLNVAICPAEFRGRYFYNSTLTGFNFSRSKFTLSQLVDQCLKSAAGSNSYYLEAAKVDVSVPGLAADLDMTLVDTEVRPRLWLGTSVRTQTHFDLLDNIAVHVAGEKEFILFPPDQIANLYPGPIDFSPAGVPISMVQPDNPDLDRYPRFRHAMASATVARLEPGDALYLPALWWHYVATEGPLNMLVNYWWSERRSDIYPPITALYMAALSFKQMPAAERNGWAQILDYFIFERDGDPVEHLPPHMRSVFAANLTAGQLEQFKILFRQTTKL